ncbi:MAG: lamin tail domain-containing protein, partial [Candidatus Bipolaricaulota bacterium]|nr:lamin tail domain-containing protein [Candidatus Bipolaricaulota bacterium]MDW8126762.1 lamin tail domain-containing protein [Candidatus Bipolaricaulota bacterium]
NGNTATCQQKVTVNDCEDPQVICPAPITRNVDPGTCGASVTFRVTATDNCGVASLEYFLGPNFTTKITSPYTFPVRTTTVKAVATDAAGNTAECSFTVTVNETAPAISVVKIADRTSARVGETITYTITVRNIGNVYLSSVVVTDPTLGTLVGPTGDDGDGVLELTETWVYTGTYTLTTADAGRVVANTATVTAVDPCGKTVRATSNIVVVPWTNSPPTTAYQTLTTCKNTPLTFTLIADDVDIDPDNPELHPLTFNIIGGPANGTGSGNLAAVTYSQPHRAEVTVTYTPALDFRGEDTITFEVWDPFLSFAIGTVRITVEPCGEEVPAGGAAAYAPVVVNEIAWAGTPASPEDQWIELINVTDQEIDLTGWILRWRRKFPNTPEEAEWKVVELRGVIPPYGYFLLERGHDNVVSDVPADLIYPRFVRVGDREIPLLFSLKGDIVELLDTAGNVIDTANAERPERDGWIAGSPAPLFATMERIDPYDRDHEENWATNRGIVINGLDAQTKLLTATAYYVNEESLIRTLAAQEVLTVEQGDVITTTFEPPAWARGVTELPRITVTLADVAGGAGALVPPEDLGDAVTGRRLEGFLNYQVTVDTASLGEGTYQIWLALGKGTLHLLTLKVVPSL